MEKHLIISNEDMIVIKKQIKLQQKSLLIAPLLIAVALLWLIMRWGGKFPPLWIILISMIPIFLVTIYSPILKGNRLGKIFYKIDVLDDNSVQFTTFGTLWSKERIVAADMNDITINKIPLLKPLYEVYNLNEISIGGKKYYIFNTLLAESFLANK